VRVEYDASRLTDAAIHKLLRRAGLDIVETVAGSAQPEEGSVLTLRCYENP
jgi:hypothetical protein